MAKRYHFSCGNSSTGPVGFCGAVRADSPQEAVRIFKDTIVEDMSCARYCMPRTVEYIQVYFNVDAITESDIDEVEEEDELEEAEGDVLCPR